MTADVEIEVRTTVKLDIDLAARWFANLDDDAQARFFVAVCRAAREQWSSPALGLGMQWYQIGSHLKNCECSSDDARDMIREMHNGLETGSH